MIAARQDYSDVVTEVVSFCEIKQYPNLSALYVGGSVARGDYVPGRSDIDLYAVAEVKDREMEQAFYQLAKELGQAKLPEVSKAHPQPVGISFTTIGEIKEGISFLGAGFEYHNFIHTSRLLWGRDIKHLPPPE